MSKDITSLLPLSTKRVLLSADLGGTIPHCAGIGNHTRAMANTFTSMLTDLEHGDSTSVIQFVNRGSIRADVESILGRPLDAQEAITAGRQAPCHIADLALSRACTIARELQAIRASARKTCQMYQAHGVGSKHLHSKLTRFINDALDLLNPAESDDDTFEDY